MSSLSFRRCTTCLRNRPQEEFIIPDPADPERRSTWLQICRPCRVKLWNDPDDFREGT